MKRKRLVLLIILLAIIYPRESKAQMPVTASNPSTEREIPNTSNLLPIKTEKWTEDNIVSLNYYYSSTQNLITYPSSGDLVYHFPLYAYTSVLGLTELGTTNIRTVALYGYTITDFYITDRMIYLCGYDYSTSRNFITFVGVDDLFNNSALLTLNLHYINLPSLYYLTRIDYYSSNEEKLSLIVNKDGGMESMFITYFLSNDYYETFESPRVRLLDVVHTDNKIGVLGMQDDSTFTLISHDINDYHIYQGKYFVTGELYNLLPDSRFHMTNLRNELNQVVIGASVHDISSLQFTIADLTSVSMVSTQSLLDHDFSCRSKILSIKFDERDYLYCLFANGCKYGMDMIMRVQPYSSTPYDASVYIPQNSTEGYNFLQDITIYENTRKLLALGREIGFNLYLYDRYVASTANYCDRVTRARMIETENPIERGDFLYENQITDIAPVGIANIIRPTTNYIINCQ